MTDFWIFSIGAVIFIFLTGATILFMYFRFNDVYRVDQAADPAAPEIVMDGNTEVFASREVVRA